MGTPSNDSGIAANERRACGGSSSRKSTYCPPLATPDDDGGGGVLVVDDHKSIRFVVRAALEAAGYVVAEAADGAEALRVTRLARPQLILLDWDMPVLNGPDFAAAYHEEPGPHAPIVLITAATLPAHRAAELGAVGFLAKPFTMGALVEMVARFVDAGSTPR